MELDCKASKTAAVCLRGMTKLRSLARIQPIRAACQSLVNIAITLVVIVSGRPASMGRGAWSWIAKSTMNHPLRTLLRELFVDPVLGLLRIRRPKRPDTPSGANSQQPGPGAGSASQSARPVSQSPFVAEEIRKEA